MLYLFFILILTSSFMLISKRLFIVPANDAMKSLKSHCRV